MQANARVRDLEYKAAGSGKFPRGSQLFEQQYSS